MTPESDDPLPPRLGLLSLFLKFLSFGALAFGGPVAQIAMIRQALVEEERWISRKRFNRLLAVMQALPGPEAHELCVHLGMVARGRIGGLLAGLGFMLPGLLLMLLAGWLYEAWIVGQPGVASVLYGVQVVVLAIIVRAVHRIGRHILEDRLLWLLAIVCLVATLAGVPFWIPLVAAGIAYGWAGGRWLLALVVVVAVVLAVAAYLIDADADPVLAATAPASALALFYAGLKGGLLTFGGAYTAIPYVRTDTVGRGWVSDAAFLDGIALAGLLPAPLVIFATFIGYVAGGWVGALAITAGMFIPAFAFSMILFERLEAIVENPALHRLLTGIAAAVVGIIAATCLQLGETTLARAPVLWSALGLFAFALVAAWFLKGKWVAPVLLLAGGGTGWLLFG